IVGEYCFMGSEPEAQRSRIPSAKISEDPGKTFEGKYEPSRWLFKWSHVIAGLVFCFLYFPFKGHPWRFPVAIAVSYSVYAFAIALGLGLDYADDFLGDPR